jgi:glycosyltransferase involved in cell wall biosynthesis
MATVADRPTPIAADAEPPAGSGGDQPCEVTIVAHDIGPVGGMERQLHELVLGLRRMGHPVTVIGWRCELPQGSGVVFHRVAGPRRPFLLGYPLFMLLGSLAVRRWRRGVVQSTGALVLNHVDVVAIHCCHQVYRGMPKRSTAPLRAYARLMAAIKRFAERMCVRWSGASAFVCVSDGVAEEMRRYYPRAAKRVTTIHNGVDTDVFAPAAHEREASALRASIGVAEQRLLAAFVGGSWEHKGLACVIEALPKTPGWDLLVAGDGDQQRYQQLARDLGVADAVHWLGVVREAQVVYALADAFVLPSRYETFSLVTFEAAASGLPVLATPVSGVRELIVDGESGFLIARDGAAIAERLNTLAADPALRKRLGEAARQAALPFSWEEMVAKHHQLYTRLATGSST